MNASQNGKILLTSYLQKRSSFFHSWKNRFCVLTEKYLFIYKGAEKNSETTNSINLAECTKINNSDKYLNKSNTFELVHRNKSHYFLCKNKDIQEDWIDTINQIIEKNIENSKNNISNK